MKIKAANLLPSLRRTGAAGPAARAAIDGAIDGRTQVRAALQSFA